MLGGASQHSDRSAAWPSPETYAAVLTWSAVHTDEVSKWILRDEAALDGRIDLQSRWVALEVLCSLYPKHGCVVLGAVIGFDNRCSGDLSRRMMTDKAMRAAAEKTYVAMCDARDLPDGPMAGLQRTLTGLLRDRADARRRN